MDFKVQKEKKYHVKSFPYKGGSQGSILNSLFIVTAIYNLTLAW